MTREIVTRIQNRIDTEENWNKAEWIPLIGEMIVYIFEEGAPKTKFGDGKSKPRELPFLSVDLPEITAIPEDKITALFN